MVAAAGQRQRLVTWVQRRGRGVLREPGCDAAVLKGGVYPLCPPVELGAVEGSVELLLAVPDVQACSGLEVMPTCVLMGMPAMLCQNRALVRMTSRDRRS